MSITAAASAQIPDGIELQTPEGYRLAQIPLKYLDHFPGNVRKELDLNRAYLASLKEEQQVPVTVIPIPAGHEPDPDNPEVNPDALFWVTKGNRRLAGARKVELESLLCLIDLTKADQQALLYIDQVVENDEDFRRPLSVWEKNQALTLAFDAGATRTEIRKRTGRSRKEISDALAAGKLAEQAKKAAQAMDYAWTTEELALLTEFQDDPDALARIETMVDEWGRTAEYAIEVVRRERQEAAAKTQAHAKALAVLEEAAIPVTDHLPADAILLDSLSHLVEDFDPADHATCPGRGAFFYAWRPEQPDHYCTTPDRHGYTPPPPQPVTAVPAQAKATPEGPPRRIVVEGNRAWEAAGTVRQRWLAAFFARKSAPKPVARFVTRMLNDMPTALREALGHARSTTLYGKLGGPSDLEAALATASPGRLAMLQLLPIAVAFEYQMTLASKDCKNTWRHGRYSPCSVSDATLWLRFLVQQVGPVLGDKAYAPAPIETSLIDGVPYRGDAPVLQDDDVSDPEQDQEEPQTPEEPESAEIADPAPAVDDGQVAPKTLTGNTADDAAEADATIAELLHAYQQPSPLERFDPAGDHPDAEEAATDPMAA